MIPPPIWAVCVSQTAAQFGLRGGIVEHVVEVGDGGMGCISKRHVTQVTAYCCRLDRQVVG